MSKSRKVAFIALFSLIFISGSLWFANNAQAEPDKEYRSGQVISISGKNYLIASNKEFAEIIEITADNKLTQISEVHGAENIQDLYVGKYLNKYFLVIATGQYLYRYDISNPAAPKIEFKRDMYTFKRGQFKIGSINILIGNKDYLFGAGSNGVRSFNPDNLFVYKIYTFDKSYGVAADDKNLFVITESKGLVFDIASGNKLAEVNLENKDKAIRQPYFDELNNAYFPTDRGLIKLNILNGQSELYANPVPRTENFSYGVTSLINGDVYYVNGHGITVLNKNFNKIKFFNSSKGNLGANSWAVGITAAKLGTRELIVNFNKSSILLFDKNLKALSQYKYKKLYSDSITQDLKITASAYQASAGQKINLQLYGFWPNETVNVSFGKNSYSMKVDNQGYAVNELTVPDQASGKTIIQAVGQDSKFSYQIVFTVL